MIGENDTLQTRYKPKITHLMEHVHLKSAMIVHPLPLFSPFIPQEDFSQPCLPSRHVLLSLQTLGIQDKLILSYLSLSSNNRHLYIPSNGANVFDFKIGIVFP